MGAIVNALAVLVAGSLGMLINTGVPENIHERVMQGLGLCVLVIGINGALEGDDVLIMIISVVVGTIIGEWLDLEGRLNRWVDKVQAQVKHIRGFENIGQGFVTATLLFCVGSMAIVGSIESGLIGDNSTLYAKSLMDAIASVLLASSLGVGVIFSSVPLLIYQGGLTLLATQLAPFLTPDVISEVIAVGSLTLIGLSFNLLKITQLKIMNFTPAIFMPFLLSLVF